MKFVVCVLVLTLVVISNALTSEQIGKIRNTREECGKESGVDLELVAKVRKGEFTEDDKLKSYLYCFSKKIGFQNAAGEIQKEAIRIKIQDKLQDQSATNKLVDKCAVQESTPEETAYNAVKCVFENANVPFS